MTADLEVATKIAERVSKRMKKWEIPIEVRSAFVIMVSQVMKEIRLEERRRRKEQRAKG
jgi:ribose 5-phosphate isomerase